MSDRVEFNEDHEFHFRSREILGESRKPGMVAWLEKKGIVKDERMAQYVLLAVILSGFIISGFIYAGSFGGGNIPNITPEEEIKQRIESLNIPNDIKQRRIERLKTNFN